MELHYQRASLVKDGGSIIVDFTDENHAPVSFFFRKDNKVFLADHDEDRIAMRSLVSNTLELAALEKEIAAHIEKLSSTEHESGRARRSGMMTEAETLLLQGNTEKSASLYKQVEREEEEFGDGDYDLVGRALKILQNAQKP